MDRERLVKNIRNDLNDMIERYLVTLEKEAKTAEDLYNHATGIALLDILGAIQACVSETYKLGLGEKETAMLYYSIADQIVAKIASKNVRQE